MDLETVNETTATLNCSSSTARLDKLERLVDIKLKDQSYLCCSGTGRISKHLITYSGQIIISLALLGFSFYSIAVGQNKELSIGLISGVTGYFLPHPKLEENKK